MKIVKEKNGNELYISLEGRLDSTSSPDLEKEIQSLDGITSLIFDFKDLEYISSAGLRLILHSQKIMNKQGRMVVKNVRESVKDIFKITGFYDNLTFE